MENNPGKEPKDFSVDFDKKKIIARKLQKLAIGVGIVVLFGGFIILISNNKKVDKLEKEENLVVMDLDAGSSAANTENMWRHAIEDKQKSMDLDVAAKLEKIKSELDQKLAETDSKKDQEITYLKEKLRFIQEEMELNGAQGKNSSGNQLEVEADKVSKINVHMVSLVNNKNAKEYEPLKTPDNYIPAATIIKGITLNGLRVSTASEAMGDPEAIAIELVDDGILPNSFRNKVKDCRIIGEAHGILSSESVRIRTSKLSCIEKLSGESIETDLIGAVVGEDGYTGIKGTVVSIDQRHIANASIFGVLGGLADMGVKDPTSYNAFTIGTGAVQPMDNKQKVTNSLFTGAGNSFDKITDYYIRHAERISPVIEVPPGIPVTVSVLKGSYFGASTINRSIAKKNEISMKQSADVDLIKNMEIR